MENNNNKKRKFEEFGAKNENQLLLNNNINIQQESLDLIQTILESFQLDQKEKTLFLRKDLNPQRSVALKKIFAEYDHFFTIIFQHNDQNDPEGFEMCLYLKNKEGLWDHFQEFKFPDFNSEGIWEVYDEDVKNTCYPRNVSEQDILFQRDLIFSKGCKWEEPHKYMNLVIFTCAEKNFPFDNPRRKDAKFEQKQFEKQDIILHWSLSPLFEQMFMKNFELEKELKDFDSPPGKENTWEQTLELYASFRKVVPYFSAQYSMELFIEKLLNKKQKIV